MKVLTHVRLQFIIDSNAQSKDIPMIFLPNVSAQASYMENVA